MPCPILGVGRSAGRWGSSSSNPARTTATTRNTSATDISDTDQGSKQSLAGSQRFTARAVCSRKESLLLHNPRLAFVAVSRAMKDLYAFG